MKIEVKQILSARGETMDFVCSEPWREELQQFQGIQLCNPYSFEGQMKHEGSGRLRLTGRAIVRLVGFCARCTAPVHQEQTIEVQARFHPSERRHSEEDWVCAGVGDAEDEPYAYEGSVVEVEETLMDAILPQLPLRLLCREDCAGLCPYCGMDHNHGSCTCAEEQRMKQSPFAGLLDCLNNGGEEHGSTEEKMV